MYIMLIYTMLELARVVGLDWDDSNARKSLDKHGVTQREAEEVFVNTPLVIAKDVKHSQTEGVIKRLANP